MTACSPSSLANNNSLSSLESAPDVGVEVEMINGKTGVDSSVGNLAKSSVKATANPWREASFEEANPFTNLVMAYGVSASSIGVPELDVESNGNEVKSDRDASNRVGTSCDDKRGKMGKIDVEVLTESAGRPIASSFL